MNPIDSRQKLDPTARLNYAKVYTVEYNVKVWFIGEIHPRSEPQLAMDFNRVHPPLPVRSPPVHNNAPPQSSYAPSSSYQTSTNASNYTPKGPEPPYTTASNTHYPGSEYVPQNPETPYAMASNIYLSPPSFPQHRMANPSHMVDTDETPSHNSYPQQQEDTTGYVQDPEEDLYSANSYSASGYRKHHLKKGKGR